eukprot:1184090-Prorocentrum_minimum.AAC.3
MRIATSTEFPLDDAEDERLQDVMEKLRAKFKVRFSPGWPYLVSKVISSHHGHHIPTVDSVLFQAVSATLGVQQEYKPSENPSSLAF